MKIYNSLYASVYSGVFFVCCGNLMDSPIDTLIGKKTQDLEWNQWQHEADSNTQPIFCVNNSQRASTFCICKHWKTFLHIIRKFSFQGAKQISPPAMSALLNAVFNNILPACSLFSFSPFITGHSAVQFFKWTCSWDKFCCFLAAYWSSFFF